MGLQQPYGDTQDYHQSGAHGDDEAAQAFSAELVAGAEGSGDDGGGGDAKAHLQADDQLLHGQCEAQCGQWVAAELANEGAVDELEGHQ